MIHTQNVNPLQTLAFMQ